MGLAVQIVVGLCFLLFFLVILVLWWLLPKLRVLAGGGGGTPSRIHLVAHVRSEWTDAAAANDILQTLHDAGFTDAGNFSITEMPDVKLQALVHQGSAVWAVIYEHPRVGVWVDLGSRYKKRRPDQRYHVHQPHQCRSGPTGQAAVESERLPAGRERGQPPGRLSGRAPAGRA
ncbi:MAG: hypothetical protein NTW87_21220 [Planctomycetota bacterium]|nr:hypothetical protein [Planctomycetota bacterium]